LPESTLSKNRPARARTARPTPAAARAVARRRPRRGGCAGSRSRRPPWRRLLLPTSLRKRFRSGRTRRRARFGRTGHVDPPQDQLGRPAARSRTTRA
jgi:hypothetical protein